MVNLYGSFINLIYHQPTLIAYIHISLRYRSIPMATEYIIFCPNSKKRKLILGRGNNDLYAWPLIKIFVTDHLHLCIGKTGVILCTPRGTCALFTS